ncbi:MAG: hypothetical protein IJT16_07790 [Lachnospiraceae bacterium]|nr:hypothetical protein [Lachnospiraceae bacterium]
MQWYDKTAKNMAADAKYSRKQLISLLREDTPSLNDGSYQWAVGGMLKSGEIIRTGFDEYMVASGNSLPEYLPAYTPLASGLLMKVADKFPYIGFTVFETVLMNDFLNHLIAQNTIFLQVEKDASAYVFRFLQDEGTGKVMYKPTKKDFNLYWAADSVIVTDMVSEAPIASDNPHVITIEKMLVDMYCDKLIQSTYSKAEYPSVLEQVIKIYKVERPKILRYAGRRNRAAEIKKLLEDSD